MNNYYIFRIGIKNDSKCEYLTADKVTFSTDVNKVLLMSEAEASDNCNEYSDDKHIAGCGSVSR
jgi:hypothetical protein